ncbi:MAG: hypothetical protein J7M08_07935 [Planctomycetes bacterium]|nr:hypothetical protein [Planctomycetota bacterium]
MPIELDGRWEQFTRCIAEWKGNATNDGCSSGSAKMPNDVGLVIAMVLFLALALLAAGVLLGRRMGQIFRA